MMIYAASRYGYRAGGFNLRATNPVEYQPFDPETVLDAELGAKTDWAIANWHMRSNVAVYHQWRPEEHTSELQSIMRNSYDVFCLNKKIKERDNIITYID